MQIYEDKHSYTSSRSPFLATPAAHAQLAKVNQIKSQEVDLFRGINSTLDDTSLYLGYFLYGLASNMCLHRHVIHY